MNIVIPGALAGAGKAVVGVSVSAEVQGETWAVVHLTEAVQDIAILNLNVDSAKQVSL